MTDVLLDALTDTAKVLPLLYLSYLLLEFLNQRRGLESINHLFQEKTNVLWGALLGCIPQCGFSIIVAQLFAARTLSVGTLVACFIATSDEALPLFLSHPERISELALLIGGKLVCAVMAGYLIDCFMKITYADDDEEIVIEGACDCSPNIFLTALRKCLYTAVFILGVNVVLGMLIFGVGTDKLSSLLGANTIVQIPVATILGFVPNCAISVMLVELYFNGMISFGAMFAGLCTGAGVGMAVLVQKQKDKTQFVKITAYLALFSVIAGYLLNGILL